MTFIFTYIALLLTHSIFDLDLTQTIFLASTLLAAIGLIVIIYSRNRESVKSRLFILILLLVIGYLISHAFHFLIMHSSNVTILDNSCHSFLLMIIVAVTFFTWNFPEPRRIGVIKSMLIIIPSVILLGLLWTGYFIEESHAHEHSFTVKYSSLYPVFLLWYALLVAINFYWLIKRYNTEENSIQKKQILLLFLGLIITNLASFIFGLFLPWYLGFYYLVEISPLSFLAGVILFTTVAVNRYDMFRASMQRIHNFSISKKIILSASVLVPIIILLVQVPLMRFIFQPESNRELYRLFIISVFGGVVVSIIIAFVIVKIISNPLKMLKNKAHEIEKGSYGIKIEFSSNDEFGELTEAFNNMSETLKNNSSELRSKEERISLLLNAFEESSAAIAIVNEDFRIIEANHQFCQIVKTDREKIIDEYLVDVQFKGELNEYFTMIKNELQLYSKFRGELNYDNKILLIYVTPSSTGSKFNGYLFIEVDITEQKKLEEQLVKSEKLAALGKMAAVLAHEIKTPLTSIKMNTDIIAAELKLNKDEKENIAIIQTEINQLNNLVKDVLQFSRQMELDISEFNLFDLVEKIKHQLNSKLKSKNISLLNNLGKIDLMADRQRLTQVFLNLIDNSIEAISSNGKIELKSFIDEDKNNVQILVIDSGTGISDDIKVFEPFYTTKTSGTGLGLSITQKIVEQHKGKINLVSSKPGETIFEIVFPLNELNKTEKNNFVQ
ncbi:MAG: HAMP domain-containing protein [Ignavibacteriota bacterium]|nr:HAMP domain-containing protein [Ignavibacterium album]MDT3696756.1 ATP-binding protein [Ignavibacterium sp.]QKJ99267.1 MAG: HAMP domain-containing protein [Ignavibacteriota bacterium]HOJ07254.1 ATP-binding protein [Ignavibacteriaceae bacterium]